MHATVQESGLAQTNPTQALHARCCIVGGGPAGVMLGFLLARAGIDVTILEKHADFFRDFRGDTIHPSTLELMYELGLLEDFLQQPHQELAQVSGEIQGYSVTIADFSHLPTHCKFIAFMPQWDFLNFLAEKGKRYPGFHLLMETEAIGLLEENGRILGVRARTPQGGLEIYADLTIGADGRHSTVRTAAAFEVVDLGAPIDVLWMRIARHPSDPVQALGRFQAGKILITLNRGDYWQCAYVIPKGSFESLQQNGLDAFRRNIAEVAPFLSARTDEIASWKDVKLLTVAVDRLRRWSQNGLLCIGDSAHAMSPIGGVGINLAIQDAVAAANILAPLLSRGKVTAMELRAVQRRREFPTRMTQGLQVFMHRRFLGPAIGGQILAGRPPLLLRMLHSFPRLCRIPARIVGLGFRPEHIRTADSTPR